MSELDASEARHIFSEVLNRAAYGQERIVLKRHGKPVAAVVSVEDLARLEQMEDMQDVREAEQVEKRAKAKEEKPVSWSKAKKRLGL